MVNLIFRSAKHQDKFLSKTDVLNSSYYTSKSEQKPVYMMVEGVRYRYGFPNGYGASIVKLPGSYGYNEDLWEMALLNRDGHLVYEFDFSDGVIGFLNDDEVEDLLDKISKY